MPFDPDTAKLITTTYDKVKDLAAARVPVAVATIVRGSGVGSKLLVLPEGTQGTLGSPELDQEIETITRQKLADERSGVEVVGEIEVFIDVFPPAPQLVIFGAVHVAQALVTLARPLGFRIVVVDARQQLATRERFPDVDELIVEWPDVALKHIEITRNTYITILTHDPKFDEPALLGALETPARYIGAVGSRKTNADRRQRLIDSGVGPESLARVRGPIGLDIGGSTPEEMAVSILAEMIAVKYGRSGGALLQVTGPIRGTS